MHKNTVFALFALVASTLAGSAAISEARADWRDGGTGLTWSAPLPGVHAQFSADRECRIELGQEWRAPTYAELNTALAHGLDLNGARYVWSSTPWASDMPAWWGRLYRVSDRTWVREADDVCYSVVCVSGAR